MPRSRAGSIFVRKALGKHEIATVQTTAIDKAGLIRLTTVLGFLRGMGESFFFPETGRFSKKNREAI
jgi:hypothetical protein